jgi:Flp pilus assembly protein TadG
MRKQRLQRNRRGAALVEAALVLPIFFTVVLGIVEFGRAMMVSQLVTNASREGARLAIVDGTTNTQVEDFIYDFLDDSMSLAEADVSVTITIDAAPGNTDPADQVAASGSGDIVTINVSVPFDKVNFVPGDYLGGKSLVGVSAMRHE